MPDNSLQDNSLQESAQWIPNLTFVIFTFNEEARLPNVIKNFRCYGKILVVDNYSTDSTVALAEAGGCDILLNKNVGWVEDYDTLEKIKAHVRTDWLYWGFADEILQKEALADLGRVITEDKVDVVSIARKNYFYGAFCREIAVSSQVKAFKKNAIDFRGNTIHNFGKTVVGSDRIYQMPPDKFIHHLISNTAASYLDTINRYTDLEVGTKTPAELNRSAAYYLLVPFKALWLDFFRRGGRQAGHPGLALSVLMLTYSLIKAIKGYEALHHLDAGQIARKNQQKVDELLQAFP